MQPSDAIVPQGVGWCGKLPARGDFLGQGLPEPWQREWDGWLQQALAAASRRINRALLRERLLAMSPWQAVVVPRAVDAPLWAAVVLSTSDRVGRVYPLLVAEAYDARTLESVALGRMRARAAQLASWLREAVPALDPGAFGQGVAQWATTPWPAMPVPAVSGDARTLGELLLDRPQAQSLWWRLDPPPVPVEVFEEPWPPRETLLLEWLAASD